MLANAPFLRYDRHHHPMWLIRQLKLNPRAALSFLGGSVFLVYIAANVFHADSVCTGLIFTLIPLTRIVRLLVDWRSRKIRLYSDGRLDYEFGVLYREGQSVSMRFGSIHYHYPDRFRAWLDCADLVLPFDAGTITDIASFREFWDIAHGRA